MEGMNVIYNFDEFLNSWIYTPKHQLTDKQVSNGISGYFWGQLFSNIICGYISRKGAKTDSEKRCEFQEEINKLNQNWQNERTNLEIEAMRCLAQDGIKHHQEYSTALHKSEAWRTEFDDYCAAGWGFRPSVSAVLQSHLRPDCNELGTFQMNIMIAQTVVLSQICKSSATNYLAFCQDMKMMLMPACNGFSGKWINAWNRTSSNGLVDALKLHYLLQGQPTVILFVDKDNLGNLTCECAIWHFIVGKSDFLTKRLCSFPIGDAPLEGAKQMLLACAAYVHDCHVACFGNGEKKALPAIDNAITIPELKAHLVDFSDDVQNLLGGK
ncbi:MAG: hypothetical protein ACI308_06230 [Muribaculaceae bacterium]